MDKFNPMTKTSEKFKVMDNDLQQYHTMQHGQQIISICCSIPSNFQATGLLFYRVMPLISVNM